MKRVLLFRHGHAQSSREAPDRERQLTDLGVKQARRIMAGTVERGLVPHLGLSSPYRRARQTMALLEDACLLAGHPRLEVREWLGCCADGDPNAAISFLTSQTADTVAVLGHQPFLTDFVRQATLREIDFQPCDLVVLGWDGSRWTLEQDLSYSDFLD